MRKPRIKLDRVDRKILDALQANARLSSAELADLVALTPSPCWRRVKRLEEEGIICAYQARLDSRRLGYEVTAFVSSRSTKTRRNTSRNSSRRCSAFRRFSRATGCRGGMIIS